jgi:hypothetical protein
MEEDRESNEEGFTAQEIGEIECISEFVFNEIGMDIKYNLLADLEENVKVMENRLRHTVNDEITRRNCKERFVMFGGLVAWLVFGIACYFAGKGGI